MRARVPRIPQFHFSVLLFTIMAYGCHGFPFADYLRNFFFRWKSINSLFHDSRVDRERDRQTDRQTYTETDWHRDRERESVKTEKQIFTLVIAPTNYMNRSMKLQVKSKKQNSIFATSQFSPLRRAISREFRFRPVDILQEGFNIPTFT